MVCFGVRRERAFTWRAGGGDQAAAALQAGSRTSSKGPPPLPPRAAMLTRAWRGNGPCHCPMPRRESWRGAALGSCARRPACAQRAVVRGRVGRPLPRARPAARLARRLAAAAAVLGSPTNRARFPHLRVHRQLRHLVRVVAPRLFVQARVCEAHRHVCRSHGDRKQPRRRAPEHPAALAAALDEAPVVRRVDEDPVVRHCAVWTRRGASGSGAASGGGTSARRCCDAPASLLAGANCRRMLLQGSGPSRGAASEAQPGGTEGSLGASARGWARRGIELDKEFHQISTANSD